MNWDALSMSMDRDFHCGDFNAMKHKAAALLQQNPKQMRANIYLAISLDRLGDRNGAVRQINECLFQNGFEPEALYFLCHLILGRGAPYADLRLLKRFFDDIPKGTLHAHPKLEFFAAEVDFHLGDKKDALARIARMSSDIVPHHYQSLIADEEAITRSTLLEIDDFETKVFLGDFSGAMESFVGAHSRVVPGSGGDSKFMQVMGRFEASSPVRASTAREITLEFEGEGDLSPSRPLVIDTLLYNGEEDLLDIHLNCHDSFVDVFILIQGDHTFTGIPKAIRSPFATSRFDGFKHKIIHIGIKFHSFSNSLFKYAWFIEALHRNAAHRSVLHERSMQIEAAADVHIISDVDEIVRKEALEIYRTGETKIRAVRLREHKFFLNFQFFGDERFHQAGLPTFTTFVGGRIHSELDPQTIRNVIARERHYIQFAIPDGGWHFSSVGAEEFLKAKYQSYSHIENTLKNNNIDFYSELIDALRCPYIERMEKRQYFAARGVDISGYHPVPLTSANYPKYLIEQRALFEESILQPMKAEETVELIDLLQRRTYATGI